MQSPHFPASVGRTQTAREQLTPRLDRKQAVQPTHLRVIDAPGVRSTAPHRASLEDWSRQAGSRTAGGITGLRERAVTLGYAPPDTADLEAQCWQQTWSIPSRESLATALCKPGMGVTSELSALHTDLLDSLDRYRLLVEKPIGRGGGAYRRATPPLTVAVSAALGELEVLRTAARSLPAPQRQAMTDLLRRVHNQSVALVEIATDLETPEFADTVSSLSLDHLMRFVTTGLGPKALLRLGAMDMLAQDRRLFETTGVKVTARTARSVIFRPDRQTQAMVRFGNGRNNTVYQATVRNHDLEFRTIIFKPLQATRDEQFGGLRKRNATTTIGNLASWDIAQALGFDVIVETGLGIGQIEPWRERGQLGVVMARAPGMVAREWFRTAAIDSAELRREAVKLQLLDCLTGYTTRHNLNYLIDVNPSGGVKITGIDNDRALTFANRRPLVPRNRLPPIVDTEMVAAFAGLTPTRLNSLLADCGVERGTTDIAVAKLEHLHRYFGRLERRHCIIGPTEWMLPRVTEALRESRGFVGRFIK